MTDKGKLYPMIDRLIIKLRSLTEEEFREKLKDYKNSKTTILLREVGFGKDS